MTSGDKCAISPVPASWWLWLSLAVSSIHLPFGVHADTSLCFDVGKGLLGSVSSLAPPESFHKILAPQQSQHYFHIPSFQIQLLRGPCSHFTDLSRVHVLTAIRIKLPEASARHIGAAYQ